MGDALPERLRSKIAAEPNSGCWLWEGKIAKRTRYGVVYLDGRHQYAHRAVYSLLVGPIPQGLQIDHLCRVRACVNPDHLEPVTQHENLLRGAGHIHRNGICAHCGTEMRGRSPHRGSKGGYQTYCLPCNAKNCAARRRKRRETA